MLNCNGISTSWCLKKKRKKKEEKKPVWRWFGSFEQDGDTFGDRWWYRACISWFKPLPENSLQESGWSQESKWQRDYCWLECTRGTKHAQLESSEAIFALARFSDVHSYFRFHYRHWYVIMHANGPDWAEQCLTRLSNKAGKEWDDVQPGCYRSINMW